MPEFLSLFLHRQPFGEGPARPKGCTPNEVYCRYLHWKWICLRVYISPSSSFELTPLYLSTRYCSWFNSNTTNYTFSLSVWELLRRTWVQTSTNPLWNALQLLHPTQRLPPDWHNKLLPRKKKLSTHSHLSFLRNSHRKNPKNEWLCVSSGNMWTRAQLLDKLKQGMEGNQPLTHCLTTPDPKLKKDVWLYRFYHGWTAASCKGLFPGQVAQKETLSCPLTLTTTQQKSADSSWVTAPIFFLKSLTLCST